MAAVTPAFGAVNMLTRHRWGTGFTYRDRNGRTVRDRKLRRWIESLVIPPAWTDVEIDPDADAKLHATGRDSAGRKQYIYNAEWRETREHRKYDRIIRFAQRLTSMRRVTGQHLARPDNSREKVLACMVRLIDTAYFRPGNAHYAAENESYGLTTMRSKHLIIEGDELIFRYVGKGGQAQEKHVEDRIGEHKGTLGKIARKGRDFIKEMRMLGKPQVLLPNLLVTAVYLLALAVAFHHVGEAVGKGQFGFLQAVTIYAFGLLVAMMFGGLISQLGTVELAGAAVATAMGLDVHNTFVMLIWFRLLWTVSIWIIAGSTLFVLRRELWASSSQGA